MSSIAADTSRSQRLKAATHDAHERLDRRIMAAQPFASREHYARFVQAQYRFHCDLEPVYANPVLASVVPELAQRRRLPQIRADLADLGVPLPAVPPVAPAATAYDTQVSALGWLYVAEGSSLGAAILLKLALRLGLDEHFGAR
ncbi:biliverdin-producing heme oxygenase, partial [Xanthomonas sp. Kuri4-2]